MILAATRRIFELFMRPECACGVTVGNSSQLATRLIIDFYRATVHWCDCCGPVSQNVSDRTRIDACLIQI